MVTHKWSYCDLCECHITLCGTCGNNVCNGGAGEVDGEPCPDCESSYQEWIANPEKVQANKPASTPDIAGLCNRDPATFPTNDPTNPLHRLADDLQRGRLKVEGVKEDVTYALSTLERQAAEIERLREALEEADRLLAALTGEDTATLGLSGKTQTDDRTRGDG